MKWFFYIDWGSGYVLVNPKATRGLTLSWVRGVLNDFIQRKELEGSFQLKDAEFDTAETFFITDGNYEAPLRIYENGTMGGSGVLKFDGRAQTNGKWDNRESLVTFDTFESDDQYTNLVAKFSNSFFGWQSAQEDDFTEFGAQGQDPDANKLLSFTWNGTVFTLLIGTPLAVPNLGQSGITEESGEVAVYDGVNGTMKTYVQSGGQWSQLRSTAGINVNNSIVAAAGMGGGKIAVVVDRNFVEFFQTSGPSSITSTSSFSMSKVKFPSICYTGSRLAIVDEHQKTLRVLGLGGDDTAVLSLGEIKKPQICEIDTATETIALIDTAQSKLVTYRYSGGVWTQIGNSLLITNLVAPNITFFNTNQIIFHDTTLGVMRHYTFNGTDWIVSGNTYSIGGGFTSALGSVSLANIMLAISDTPSFRCSTMTSYYSLIFSLLANNSIRGSTTGLYELEKTGNDASIDISKLILGDMSDLSDNQLDVGDLNKFKYKLGDALKYYELFQDYWYVVDGVSVSNKIKFIQPDSFSSFGTPIDITSLLLTDDLDQKTYKKQFQIDQEEIILNNVNSLEFTGNVVDYSRNTPEKETTIYPLSTDLQFIAQLFKGHIQKDISRSGLIAWYRDNSSGKNIAPSDTGVVTGNDTKNNILSQSQIMESFWKTYRFGIGDTVNNQITINGSVISAPATMRDAIDRPDVQLTIKNLASIGITEFPDELSNLVWGIGDESLIMRYSTNLFTDITTISSRVHDL